MQESEVEDLIWTRLIKPLGPRAEPRAGPQLDCAARIALPGVTDRRVGWLGEQSFRCPK